MVQEEIKSQSQNPEIDLVLSDLSTLSSVRNAAAIIKSKHEKIDVLINNASIYKSRREKKFNSLNVFGATKMMNLLFTFELARRLENTGVTVNAVHTGMTRSSLMNETSAPMQFLLRLASAPAERVAVDIIRVALDPEFEKVTGRFFHKAKEIEPAAYAHDRTAQQRLWEISSNLTGITENKVDIPSDLTL